VLDYQVNWTDWLDGDTIVSSAFTAETGITKDAESNTPQVATVWLSDGDLDEDYEVKNEIMTVRGRTGVRRLTVPVREK
jgi:hypothetical protein